MRKQKGFIETLAILGVIGMVAMMGACMGLMMWGGHMMMKDREPMPKKQSEEKIEKKAQPQPSEPKAEEPAGEPKPPSNL